MKKVFLVLSAVAMLACVSCKKTCDCTTYLDGEKVLTKEVDRGDKKCKDLTTVMEQGGKKTGLECK